MELYDEWPLLEFTDIRKSILSRFSSDASDSVAHLLIRELVENIDKPLVEKAKIANEQELEWMMQIINHAFSLSFSSPRDFETIHSAVRIYLTWCSALTVEVHPSCPQPLRQHPDRYFRRMLEAMRLVFIPRGAADADGANKQVGEMRSILSTLLRLSAFIVDEFKDECWSKLILFLLSVNSQMLDDPSILDDSHSPVAIELIGTLFNCWTSAAMQEYIPSLSYWKTFTQISKRWVTHIPLVEQWGRKVLPLAATIIQKTFKDPNWGPAVPDDKILHYISFETANTVPKELADTWFRTFHVMDRPAAILAADVPVGYSEHLSLSFFLTVLVHCRLIDLIYGDTKVPLDFRESDEVCQLWVDACKDLHEEWSRSYHQHRTSNMSSTSGNGFDNSQSSQHTLPSAAGNTARKTAIIPGTKSVRGSTRNGTAAVSKESTSSIFEETAPLPEVSRPKIGQFVFHYLKSNPFARIHRFNGLSSGISSVSMLDVFLFFLGDAAQATAAPGSRRPTMQVQEDAISQRSMSSVDFDSLPVSGAGGDRVTRRSFAQSTTSSSDYSILQSTAPSSACDFPVMDGVAAGRAAALGALCRIVCEKSSNEEVPPDQLAQFYLIIHKALIERERLSLCSILYYGTELFKLGLKGVEILFPNYLMAIDIILTESFKLRLHPSIQEVEMRHTCLQALSSIVAWPTTYGAAAVVDDAAWNKLGQGTNNMLEPRPTFLDLRQRILRSLVHTLRNELDSTNLYLALSSCAVFCFECCRHDLDMLSCRKVSVDEEDKLFAVSAVKAVISAICDNIYKTQWTTELTISLAALDCLNSFAAFPTTVLFHNEDMSTGSLIVASLCRFIDVQLRKPPMYHSRDLHSSVVAAYSSLGVWLIAAPKLAEIEFCLTTVAEAVEFGLTGGRNLKADEHKPASLRVRDAADSLLNILLSFSTFNNSSDIVDERKLLYKYGPQAIDTTKFKHYLLNQNAILSVHEASHIEHVSKGLPSVFAVTRTPFALASTAFFQLKPSTLEQSETAAPLASAENSPASTVLDNPSTSAEATKQPLRRITDARPSIDSNFDVGDSIKQFEFPPGFDKPLCRLDTAYPELQTTAEASGIITQIQKIQQRLQAGGGCASGNRDSQNIWIQSGLGALLSQQLKPQNPACRVNSVRNFLYDLGLVDEGAHGSNLVPLDSGKCDEFYRDLHQVVDRTHVRTTQTVGIFYVRAGQRQFSDILNNALYLDETSPEFCQLLAELGECVEVTNHPHWTGHWATAFSAERKPIEPAANERYTLDGISHCLWWADHLLEMAFVVYSERSHRLHSLLAGGPAKDPKFSVVSKPPARDSVVDSAFEDDGSVVTAGSAAHHHSWHQLRNHIRHSKEQHHMASHHHHHQLQQQQHFLVPEANNNGTLTKPGHPVIDGRHSPHIRRCLSISTAQAAAAHTLDTSVSPNPGAVTPTATRLYVRHQPVSRQCSLSPRPLGDDPMVSVFAPTPLHHHFSTCSASDLTSASVSLERESSASFEIEAFDPSAPAKHAGGGPYSLAYLKNLFRRGRTPEPEERERHSLPDMLVTDSVIGASRATRSGSPASEQQNSRRSDVSQNSLLSGSSPASSNYASKTNRTKSSSTINSDCGSSATHRIGSQSTEKSPKRCIDQRVFVVWLERVEDMYHFPYEQLFDVSEDGSRYTSTRPDHVILFLHLAEPGLVRVHVDGVWTKYGQPGPLADGAMVSLSALPHLLRQTLCSICRRKCLEVEAFQSSFSRRRTAIQEFAKKYARQESYTEFLDTFIST